MLSLGLLFLLIAAVCEAQQGRLGPVRRGRCPAPSGFGICISNCRPSGFDSCRRRGQICCRNACGGFVCMNPRTVPRWCPAGSPRIPCFVNPCTVKTCPAFPWARCRPSNPCEPACSGEYYLGYWRIPDRICRRRRRIDDN